MYMVMLMRSQLYIGNEEIITQGDEAKHMYILLSGEVTVFLKQSILQKSVKDQSII